MTTTLELKPPRLFVVGVAKAGQVVVVDLQAWKKQREARVGKPYVPEGRAS